MPITATAAKGTIAIALEANPGEQLLLATTPVIATITGITAPSGSTGMRFHIKIVNWSTSGTLTITGTGLPNNTETVNVAAPSAQQIQSSQLASFEYVSVNAYTAITNITTTGMTNGLITVWGIQAGKYALLGTAKTKRTPKMYSPNEHSGIIERDRRVLQLINNTTIDELKQDAYDEQSMWWMYMALGVPATPTTIPASPTSLFTAAPLSSSQTLTAQPTTPGMVLIITITSFTVAGTITINGTSYGQTTSETISITAAGTYYSSKVYSAVSTITNVTTAATMAITGVYGWQYTWLSGANLYSSVVEWFDGTASWTHPFCLATDATFDAKAQTEITLTLKGKAQDKLAIGDKTTTPLAGTNRIVALGTPISELPIVGWQAVAYVDSVTGTPLATTNADVEEFLVNLKVPQEEHWTFTNSQNYNRAYPQKREAQITTTLDFRDLSLWEQFRMNLKNYLGIQFYGQYIGTSAGTAYYKSWAWTFPVRTDGGFDPTSDPTKGSVQAKATWVAEYDSGIGGAYRLVLTSQMPPVYPL